MIASVSFRLLLLATVAMMTVYASDNSSEVDAVEFDIVRKDSSPSWLFIEWTVPEEYSILSFRVESRKKDSDSVIVGPIVPGPAWNYTINDLMTNSEYTVCLSANLTASNSSSSLPDIKHTECSVLRTPPSIRWDSVLVLVLVILLILTLVLLGYICWRKDLRKAEGGDEEDEEETGSPIEEKIENGEKKPFLLNAPPPAKELPQKRIEDEDIPFITPTWDQIARERGNA